MAWDYCCCAIPLLNVGAYFILSEQFVLGILVGTLAIGTPAIVAAATPDFAKLIMMALGYVFAVIQLVGFFGIFKEKPALFKTYVTLNTIFLYLGLSAAAAFIGISAGRHQVAVDACDQSFFTSNNQTTTAQNSSEGQQVCNVFTWVVLGVMGALLAVLFVVQTYFTFVLRGYGATQRADHSKYHSIYSQPGTDQHIMLNDLPGAPPHPTAADEWDHRPSTDSWHPNQNPLTAGRGYRDDDDGDRVYEKKFGYGNGGVSTSVQDVGSAIKDPDAAPGYTTATTEAYYAPPSGLPPGAPSYYAHEPVNDGPSGQVHYNVGQIYGQ